MLLTLWVKRLMIATAALSILGALLLAWADNPLPLLFALEPRAVWGAGSQLPGVPAIWQLFTYPFFVFQPLGLVFVVLLYGWFGGTMESYWGSRRFLRFFLLTTVVPAALTVLLALAWPALAATRQTGPYPFIEALIVAWGLTFRDREVRLFFVLPMRGIHLVYLTVGIIALYIVFTGTVAPFVPHLLGMAIAAVVVTGGWRFDRWSLQVRKRLVELQLRREQERRRRRVSEAEHLRVVKREEEAERRRREGGDDGEPRPGGRGNGAQGGGGWLN